jgi:diguanylate cyclase (GGDEF)-like protein
VEAWCLSKANEGIRLLYKELEEKNEALKKIDQLKSDFVSTVSHELRTPLAIMKEGVSLVLDKITGEVNPQQEKTLGMVYSNINRLSQLITDLLDISKIEAGRVQLKKTLVDAGALVKDIAEKWRLESDKKKQKLQIAVPQKPVRIYLDSDKAIQVLNNLISNAIKYTPEGGAINVGLSERQDDVLLVVSDSGIGIASEDLPHAFERFRQFSRAPGAGAKGTGLGLAITRELVNLHEGTISVDSKLNKGSSFSITLPKMDSETVFKQHILSGIKEAAEKNSHLAVVTVKISDFAKLQKELGYDRMHGLLKEIEDTINSSLRRKADTVVRDTGELIVLLFDANKKSASLVRERISSVMQSFLEKKRAQGLEAVVFNIGLAAYPEDAADEGDLLNKARGVVKAKSENA